MSKLSTKLLSLVLAVVMLVSMVPVMALADGALPVLTSLTPDASMRIMSSSVSGNTYTYKVGYWNENFKFTIAYETGVTAAVKTILGAEIEPESGVYSLPLRQYSVYTYYVELTDGEETNTYTLKLQRLFNNETEIEEITGTGFTILRDGNDFVLTGDEEGKAISFGLDLSVGAAAVIRNDLGQIIVAKKGVYTISKNETLTVIVTAHDGKATEEWKISVIISKGNNDVTLSGIDDAALNGEKYVANTIYNTFLVNATVPAGATYIIYADAACTEAISNRNLKLKAATTTVYIVVTASDGVTKSAPVKLVINTTADPADEDAEAPLKMGGIDELYLRGGIAGMVNGEEVVLVLLPDNTKEYKVEAMALGYDMTLYSDLKENVIIPNNSAIKLSAGITTIYASLTNGFGEDKIVPIKIHAYRTVNYKDTQAAWAKDAIEGLAENGLGIMTGDSSGNFNGTANLSRNEMAVILCRVAGLSVDLYKNEANPFSDTLANWAMPAAKAAYLNGLMSGIKGNGAAISFSGAQKITRNGFCRAVLNAYLGDVDSYYAENKEAIDNYVAQQGFKDADQVAEWAKAGTYTAIYLGLISGTNNKNINPNGLITRNAAAVVLNNLLSA